MKITSVKVKKIEKENSRLVGIATAILDNEFIITNIKIIKGENRLFLSMPNQLMEDGNYKDIVHPLNMDCRRKFEDTILKEYNLISSKE